MPAVNYLDFFEQCKILHEKFIKNIGTDWDHHQPIKTREYENYLKKLQKVVENDYMNSIGANFLCTLLDHILGTHPYRNQAHWNFSDTDKFIDEDVLPYFGASGRILSDCLDNRMAIIRVRRIDDANLFKQSLCIARGLAQLELEIIQDYGKEATMLPNHMNAAEEEAKK